MKSTLHLLLFLLPVLTFGQSFLEPINPAPRVGDKIKVNVYFEKRDLSTLKKKENTTNAENREIEQNQVAWGTLSLAQLPADTGRFVVGPMSMTYDGQTYTTEPLILTVGAALPEKVMDGIWIRTVSHDHNRYLIIEQRIANNWKKQDDGNSITLSTEDVTFAEFDRDKFEGKGLEVVSSISSSDTQKAGSGAGTSAYRLTIFKFQNTPMFKGGLRIDKKFFSNLPKNVPIPEIVIP